MTTEKAHDRSQTRLSHFVNKITSYIWAEEEKLCYPFLRRLAAIGIERKEMVSQVIGLAVGSSVNYAQCTTLFMPSRTIFISRHSLQLSHKS